MISLPLSDIARVLSGTLHLAGGDGPDTRVGGTVDTDSRNIGPGDVFVANGRNSSPVRSPTKAIGRNTATVVIVDAVMAAATSRTARVMAASLSAPST